VSAGLPFIHRVRIYWEDTDAGGVVYHARYLALLERARTEWLRALGVHQAALQREADQVFAIRAMEIDFLAPARLDDELDVVIEAVEVGRASLVFRQLVRRAGGGATLITAKVKAASLSASRFRPLAITAELRGRLLSALQQDQEHQQ
jgi:acyl-CoA thioester hydrolase